MVKEDLKTGMLVVFRDGTCAVVINFDDNKHSIFQYFKVGGYDNVNVTITDNLKGKSFYGSRRDVIAIYDVHPEHFDIDWQNGFVKGTVHHSSRKRLLYEALPISAELLSDKLKEFGIKITNDKGQFISAKELLIQMSRNSKIVEHFKKMEVC